MLKTSSIVNILFQKLRISNDKTLNEKLSKSKNTSFLITNAKQAYIQLKQVFTEVLIFSHFDPECHIRIEIDASVYGIDSILS